jgi:periplasmic divalent cation tolerance protein
MTEVCCVYVTFPSMEVARRVGSELVERQLAACVNLLPGAISIYRWEGQIEEASEVLAIFKTVIERWEELSAAVRELHPYEVPEVLAVPASEVETKYAAWLRDSTSMPLPRIVTEEGGAEIHR